MFFPGSMFSLTIWSESQDLISQQAKTWYNGYSYVHRKCLKSECIILFLSLEKKIHVFSQLGSRIIETIFKKMIAHEFYPDISNKCIFGTKL